MTEFLGKTRKRGRKRRPPDMHPQYETALSLMARGVPRKDISEKLTIAESTLSNMAKFARANGDERNFNPMPSIKGGRSRLSPWRDDAIDMVKDGVPVTQIAKRFGVSRQRIHQILNEARNKGDSRVPPKPGAGYLTGHSPKDDGAHA